MDMSGGRALTPKKRRPGPSGVISHWRYHRREKMTGACGTMPQKINEKADFWRLFAHAA
jgi:hypothetical protein